MEITNIRTLANKLKTYPGVYMMIGHGSSNQFGGKNPKKYLESTIENIQKGIPFGSMILFFGDPVEDEKVTIGMAFNILVKKRPDLEITFIAIKSKVGGYFPFSKRISFVYGHNDYTKKCKYGGLDRDTGKPCSNTKKWVQLHNHLPARVSRIFVLGGGPITVDEVNIARKMKVPIKYFPSERKFHDKELISRKASIHVKVGPTYKLFK